MTWRLFAMPQASGAMRCTAPASGWHRTAADPGFGWLVLALLVAGAAGLAKAGEQLWGYPQCAGALCP
jgi:hypothetical protein